MTDFQRKVYQVVSTIPLGQTRTYAWVAKRVGRPRAVRAVGTALKKNPYPFIIPCHRVVKSNGDVGNYSQGKRLKRKLLEMERGKLGTDTYFSSAYPASCSSMNFFQSF